MQYVLLRPSLWEGECVWSIEACVVAKRKCWILVNESVEFELERYLHCTRAKGIKKAETTTVAIVAKSAGARPRV